MSASIKLIFECPRCKESIMASSRPDTCPACKYDFGSLLPPKEVNGYQLPYTLTEQHLKLQNSLAYNEFVMGLPIEKANDILNDALNIIQLLGGKKSSVSDIRSLVQMGLKIGEVTEAYDTFLRAGGIHAPDLLLPLQKEGTDNESKQSRIGEDTP